MTNYNLELSWVAPKPGGIPFTPISQIRLRNWATDHDKRPCVTAQCVGIRELEWNAKRLKTEIDQVVKSARRKYGNDLRRLRQRSRS